MASLPRSLQHWEWEGELSLQFAAERLAGLVLDAYRAQRDDLPDSDLDDEQPLSLTVRVTLGDIRKARNWAATTRRMP